MATFGFGLGVEITDTNPFELNPAGSVFATFGPTSASITETILGDLTISVDLTPSSNLCYVTETLIRTDRGDVRVEDLQVGDTAVTSSGQERPIVWIGHRLVDCSAQSTPSEVWPVRVRAGAFGPDRPARDLYLSPGHPVLVGSGAAEVLVPIMCLINGTTIDRVKRDTVTYWHIELDAHDILLAENLPAESFLDFGNRPWFENGADHALHNPDFVAPGLEARCRPVAVDGPQVEAERRRLDQVFAGGLAAQCAWPDTASAGL